MRCEKECADYGRTICPDPLVPSIHRDAIPLLFEFAVTQSSRNMRTHVRTKLMKDQTGRKLNGVRLWALTYLVSD